MEKIDIRSNKERSILIILSVLLILGMLSTLFLLYQHFSPKASKYCNLGGSLNCGIVNTSPYANLDGISYLLTIDLELPLPLINIKDINFFFDFITTNAFWGFLTLLFLLLLLIYHYKRKDFLFIKKEKTNKWLKGVTLFSLIYSFYLLLVQQFILKTYCVFCIFLDVIIAVTFVIIWFVKEENQ